LISEFLHALFHGLRDLSSLGYSDFVFFEKIQRAQMNTGVNKKSKPFLSNMIFKILSDFGFKAPKIAFMTL
jgi:hypothetical protein